VQPEHLGQVGAGADDRAGSCGYQVPLMTYDGDRDLLVRWSERKSDEELDEYRRTRNGHSIDGLPAFAER
jgi:hypothetical protein